MKNALMILVFTLTSQMTWAWGGRGHHTICETAVYLLKEKGLKSYLQNKPNVMGHLCNIPDIYWKSMSPEVSKLGNPTHFIDLEILGLKIEDVPTDYAQIMREYTGKPNAVKEGAKIFDVPTEVGSSWWRADQFMRRIADLKPALTNAEVPKNSKEEQDENLPYNKAVYNMMLNMGIMGHFVGDMSQPLHTSVDYDGYMAGHGGLHAFYEDTVVAYFDGDLAARVLKEARAMKQTGFLKPKTTIEKMKALSIISNHELKTVYKLDPIIKKSEVTKEKGMELRTPAERQDGEVGYKRFNKMIVTDLARSALLLANLWDEAYRSVGQPKLASYKSYKFPHTPEFIPPDYITLPENKDATK